MLKHLLYGPPDEIQIYREIPLKHLRWRRCIDARGLSGADTEAWRRGGMSHRFLNNLNLLARIRQIHWQSRQTYGIRRINAGLRAEGINCSKNRVAWIMEENNIKGKLTS